ncbi:ribosome biogenesis GTPase YlqF [Mycoplasma mycoides subsp. capri]|uniref:ribosome biogenesis GTPase YlqF n=1 Tax=Mycoplasma mycoides TaxID=2102 RepID=UPI00223F4086|nr:ribosome biogenesis GTPase YlqF [Mycoplasma mycoides]QVJ96693.1 ribosome biogenesis GTPase YlqF [Mycoplasma mycoides subsp. capri]QVJ97585.1 ribosome biogenesis GTPase YlqF [Mycoplasma mycoides subsp. capri]QVK00578.1 ribosome biogenesis GTPase YlqF [Mycoplasma mycoides subsp. capri]QVK01465.1 ribosome biogenesis GTPase YlqF [Mycoplasma mycoides subsp. capri]
MSAEFNWFPGHMNKTLKDIEARIEMVDVVVEVIDSRAPYSSKNTTFKKLLKDKPIVYIFSKADIADSKITQQWVDYYVKNENSKVIVLYNRHTDIVNDLINVINELTAKKREKDKAKGIKNTLINALVIGIPNVGKSTFINRVIKGKNVKVGNKPGVTRGIQLIHLNPFINLLDTPGVLPSKLESETVAVNICAINSIKDNVFPKERVAAKLMSYVYNNYDDVIEKYYKINLRLQKPISVIDSYKIFETIGIEKKWYVTEDILDMERILSSFLKDLEKGKLGKISFEKVLEVVPEEIQKAISPEDNKQGNDISSLW